MCKLIRKFAIVYLKLSGVDKLVSYLRVLYCICVPSCVFVLRKAKIATIWYSYVVIYNDGLKGECTSTQRKNYSFWAIKKVVTLNKVLFHRINKQI